MVVIQRKVNLHESSNNDGEDTNLDTNNANNSAAKSKARTSEKEPNKVISLCKWKMKVLGASNSGCLVKCNQEKAIKTNFVTEQITQYFKIEHGIFLFRLILLD